jgi:hypothetical protein
LTTDIQALVLAIRKECSCRKLAAGDTTVGSTPRKKPQKSHTSSPECFDRVRRRDYAVLVSPNNRAKITHRVKDRRPLVRPRLARSRRDKPARADQTLQPSPTDNPRDYVSGEKVVGFHERKVLALRRRHARFFFKEPHYEPQERLRQAPRARSPFCSCGRQVIARHTGWPLIRSGNRQNGRIAFGINGIFER